MPAALTFEHVSKQFRGAREYQALRDDLSAGLKRLVGIKRPPRPTVQALEDVSFEVMAGEAFGLIGENGAGKTTALKIATRITYPTDGRVRVRGRVGALIEVGTGLHPELTGRENVSLYGRILGLSSSDVARRFDEIVEFAGVGHAIDQPVKQYSSGMQLRLGFAVAAHLEPDVLLVDEALSVGDAGFQHRCVEKMSELVRDGGTLVLVSHSMSAIEALCTRAALLSRGRIVAEGRGRDIVQEYLRRTMDGQQPLSRRPEQATGQDPAIEIVRISLHDAAGTEVDAVSADETVTVRVHYHAREALTRPAFSVGFGDSRLGAFSSASMLVDGEAPERVEGEGHLDCVFERLPLRPRSYEIWCGIRGEHGHGSLVDFTPQRLFEVTGELPPGKAAVSWGLKTPVEIPYRWSFPETSRNGD